MLGFFRLLDRLRRDQRGNIAVVFAIALLPLLSFTGAAIDYSRANNARTSMQSSLDSVALMLSKDLTQGLIESRLWIDGLRDEGKREQARRVCLGGRDAPLLACAEREHKRGGACKLRVRVIGEHDGECPLASGLFDHRDDIGRRAGL